jgi:hypothetical protein
MSAGDKRAGDTRGFAGHGQDEGQFVAVRQRAPVSPLEQGLVDIGPVRAHVLHGHFVNGRVLELLVVLQILAVAALSVPMSTGSEGKGQRFAAREKEGRKGAAHLHSGASSSGKFSGTSLLSSPGRPQSRQSQQIVWPGASCQHTHTHTHARTRTHTHAHTQAAGEEYIP